MSKKGIFEKLDTDLHPSLKCLSELLEIDLVGMTLSVFIHEALRIISNYSDADEIVFARVVKSGSPELQFFSHINHDVVVKNIGEGIIDYCLKNDKFFIMKSIDKSERTARGLVGSIRDTAQFEESVVCYHDDGVYENSKIFFPIKRGQEEPFGILLISITRGPGHFRSVHAELTRIICDVFASSYQQIKVLNELEKEVGSHKYSREKLSQQLEKLEIGERLTFQYLMTTSHLHEMAGILSGMDSDKLEMDAVLSKAQIGGSLMEEIQDIMDRYSAHRKEAHAKLRQMLNDRPSNFRTGKQKCNIKNLINDQLKFFDKRFDNENIRIKKALAESDIELEVDSSAIKYVIRILINNSIDAVKEGSRKPRKIGVYSKQVDGFLELRFTDNGCGIPVENQTRVFEAFFTTKEEGNGVGLFWAEQTISKQHSGSIELEKSSGDIGTHVLVSLPIRV